MTENFLIRLKNADVALSGQKVLHGINWQIDPDQHWRVDGINGAGKTTLLKTIAGLIWPVAKQPASRKYCFNANPSHLLAGVKNKIGYASYGMQDDYVRGSRNISCHEVIASGFEQNIMVYDKLSDTQQRKLDLISSKLGLTDFIDHSFLSTSHGQKSAILFARALIHRPRLLILDEIFNGVDQQRFELMVELLDEYVQTGGQIILSWHEHSIEAIEALFTHRLLLDKGKVIQTEKASRIKASRKQKSKKIDQIKFQASGDKQLIALNDVDVYLQNKHVLKNINWIINEGERWLLKGENGAGKTTLLKTLLAEIRPAIGSEIWRRGFDRHTSVWNIRKLIGYVSPELQQSYHYNISVRDALASGFFSSIGLYDEVNAAQSQRIEALLEEFNLIEIADAGVHEISSGQMRRVLIARALISDPNVLIFDEITANLDTQSRSAILTDIEILIGQGKTILFVGHHDDEILSLATHILTLDKGVISSIIKVGKYNE